MSRKYKQQHVKHGPNENENSHFIWSETLMHSKEFDFTKYIFVGNNVMKVQDLHSLLALYSHALSHSLKGCKLLSVLNGSCSCLVQTYLIEIWNNLEDSVLMIKSAVIFCVQTNFSNDLLHVCRHKLTVYLKEFKDFRQMTSGI